MKLWKVTIHDPDHGRMIEWFGSKAEVSARAGEIKRERDENRYVTSREQVEVPTAKVGLLDWLNYNYNRENG